MYSGAYSKYFFRQLYDLFPTLVWVAEDDGRWWAMSAGMAQDGVWLDLEHPVLAHYRRQDRPALDVQQHRHCSKQACCIKVTAEAGNYPAIRLYEKLGFRTVVTAEDYYGDGVDRVIMERHEKERE